MGSRIALCWLAPWLSVAALAQAPAPDMEVRQTLGPANAALADGAAQLQAGNAEEGVRLLRQALATAGSAREIDVAHSNLCAGFILLQDYPTAIRHCDVALQRNPDNFHALSNRSLAYFYLEDYDAAQRDLEAGLAIAPQSPTLRKVAQLIRDTLDPVRPSVIIEYGEEQDDAQ